MSTQGYWRVKLDGVTLSGGPGEAVDCETADAVGCLTVPPAGLGLPEIRTEDVTYPQRDGVRMFSDWYTNRIITLEGVTVCPDASCPSCPSAKEAVRQIRDSWGRRCDDAELVIYTDCHGASTPGGTTLGSNIVANPGAETSLDGYSSPTSLLTRDGTVFRPGSKFSVRADSTDNTEPVIVYGAATVLDGDGEMVTPGRIPIKAGTTYRGQDWVRTEVATTVTLGLEFFDVEENPLGAITIATVPTLANTWTRLSADDFTAPAQAVRVEATMATPTGSAQDGITRLWSDDLTLYPVITIPDTYTDRELVGPFGVVGRPRVAEYTWDGISGCATMTLRFDAQDQRMYVLDECGTPGSGGQEAELNVGGQVACRTYPRCYGGEDAGQVVNRNRLVNPAVSGDTEGWASGAGTTLAYVDTPTWVGLGSLEATMTGTSGNINVNIPATDRFDVTGGETVAVMNHIQPAATARNARVGVWTQDAAGTGLPTVYGDTVPVPASGQFTEVAGLVTVPEEAVRGALITIVETPATGEVHYVDGGMVAAPEDVDGTPAVPAYFDGDSPATTDPDGNSYTYAWDGAVNDSTSRKILGGSGGGSDGWCYDNLTQGGTGPGDPVTVEVGGTLCVYPVITLHGTLTDPMIENMDTGESIGYSGTVGPVETVVFDTYSGTAQSAGGNITYLITGNPQFSIGPDDTTLRLTSYGAADDGWVELEWRPVVDGA